MADIFISHVEEDWRLALEIALRLEGAGFTTWSYEIDNLPGLSYLIQTKHEVEACKALLVIISRDSMGSSQITREIIRALETNKEFIPVRFGVTHAEYQKRKEEWAEAIGTSSSVAASLETVEEVMPRILQGLFRLNIHPRPTVHQERIERIEKTLRRTKGQSAHPPSVNKAPQPIVTEGKDTISSKQTMNPPTISFIPSEPKNKLDESRKKTRYGWHLPPLSILNEYVETNIDEYAILQRAKTIEQALASFGVDAKVVQIKVGPRITQFGIEPGWNISYGEIKGKDASGQTIIRRAEKSRTRVKTSRITCLEKDIGLALGSKSIRIEAPIEGMPLIGLEVGNERTILWGLRKVLETAVFSSQAKSSSFALVIGWNPSGRIQTSTLYDLSPILIGGDLCSGKAVFISSLICTLVFDNTPDDIRFAIIDPSWLKFSRFKGLPHLAHPLVADLDEAVDLLRKINVEMDRRYKTLRQASVENIKQYNKKHAEEKLPVILLVVYGLTDLLMVAYDEVEHLLCRFAQLGRFVGLHLIVTTSQVTSDVITELIDANLPNRIAFYMREPADSRKFLLTRGAEQLCGEGDMLYRSSTMVDAIRLQGCFVSDTEIERLVEFWSAQKPTANPIFNVDSESKRPKRRSDS